MAALARKRALAWARDELPEGACLVCTEVPDVVVELACGHSLCLACMRAHITKRGAGRFCSQCGESTIRGEQTWVTCAHAPTEAEREARREAWMAHRGRNPITLQYPFAPPTAAVTPPAAEAPVAMPVAAAPILQLTAVPPAVVSPAHTGGGGAVRVPERAGVTAVGAAAVAAAAVASPPTVAPRAAAAPAAATAGALAAAALAAASPAAAPPAAAVTRRPRPDWGAALAANEADEIQEDMVIEADDEEVCLASRLQVVPRFHIIAPPCLALPTHLSLSAFLSAHSLR